LPEGRGTSDRGRLALRARGRTRADRSPDQEVDREMSSIGELIPLHQRAELVNIARYIPEVARAHPHKRAVVMPAGRDPSGRRAYSQISFFELDAQSSSFARGLLALGVGRGTRTALMVRPSIDFFSLTFALFRIGAVPILIDPGMGVRNLIAALREV